MRREKVFGGRHIPLDRNAKTRIKVFARALMHRTEKGKHWGITTGKFLAVLDALLWGFHNCATSQCFHPMKALRNAPTAHARPCTKPSTPSRSSAFSPGSTG